VACDMTEYCVCLLILGDQYSKPALYDKSHCSGSNLESESLAMTPELRYIYGI